ncbi:hypothetical protein ABIE51_002068 [Lysobacter sp. OAE881]
MATETTCNVPVGIHHHNGWIRPAVGDVDEAAIAVDGQILEDLAVGCCCLVEVMTGGESTRGDVERKQLGRLRVGQPVAVVDHPQPVASVDHDTVRRIEDVVPGPRFRVPCRIGEGRIGVAPRDLDELHRSTPHAVHAGEDAPVLRDGDIAGRDVELGHDFHLPDLGWRLRRSRGVGRKIGRGQVGRGNLRLSRTGGKQQECGQGRCTIAFPRLVLNRW